jgi:hypothetical protein
VLLGDLHLLLYRGFLDWLSFRLLFHFFAQ